MWLGLISLKVSSLPNIYKDDYNIRFSTIAKFETLN
jgi:hypothetical protein